MYARNTSIRWSELSVIMRLQAGGDVKSCAQDVEECQGLRTAFFQCKKGQADPRSRIQGQKGY
jgi:Cytochrome c oxidase assembly protein PET191